MTERTVRVAQGTRISPPTQVHSLLHCNLNTTDLAAAASLYADVLGLSPGMKTARVPSDGRVLGVEGRPVSETWFLYDHRGPRTAPAIEVQEWESPATTGEHPAEPHHIGLSALGYAVPSLEAVHALAEQKGRPWSVLDDWPVRGRDRTVGRLLDMDGVPVEILESDSAEGDGALPVFSHLRINCADLDASLAWYARLGFTPRAVERTVPVGSAGAVFSYASVVTDGDPSFSLELTRWEEPRAFGRASQPAYHRGLYRIALGVDDVGAAHAELSAELPGIPEPEFVELPGTRLGGVTVLFLRDPDGIVVELVGRPRTAMTARR
ncbi:VOC family protein [Streptomyces sp. NPDC056660]|uniref:VOC family protein n=1 Tax=Streptomyces sp. NPDC056660 TaxID=3345897 RepID=UPI0036B75BB2